MSKLQGLFVELGVNTAAFVGGLEKATYHTRQFGAHVEREMRKVANSISFVATSFGALGPVGGALANVLVSVAGAVGKVTKEFAGLNKYAGVALGGLAGVTAGAGALSLAAIGMATKSAEAAARLSRLAQSAGVSASALSALAVPARMAGIDVEILAKGLEKMDKSALLAARSGTYSATAFGRLGINVKDATGHLKPVEDLLAAVSAKFSKMGDGAAKSGIAIEIFGKAGANLIPFLNQGAEEMKKWVDFGKKVGVVLSGDALAGARAFHEETQKVELIMQGVSNQIMVGMVGPMTQLTEAFTEAVGGGDAFRQLGRAIGEAMKFAASQTANLATGVDLVYLKAKRGLLEMERSRMFGGGFFTGDKEKDQAKKKRLGEIEGDLAEIQQKMEQAQDANARFQAKMAEPFKPPKLKTLPKPSTDLSTSKETLLPLPEKDVLGDFLAKTREAMDAELRLANAAGQTAAGLLRAKAIKDADVAIEAKREAIQDRVTHLLAEQARLKAAGKTEDASALTGGLGEAMRQLAELANHREEIRGMFAVTDAAKYSAEVRKGLADQIEGTAQVIAAQKELAAAFLQGGAAMHAATIEAKLAPEKKKIAEAKELGMDTKPLEAALGTHRQQLEEERKAAINLAAAHLSVTANLRQELSNLRELRAAAPDRSAQMAIDAQIKQAQRNAAEVWDTNAMKAGNFGDQMTATFDQIKLEGENMGAAIASSLKGALDAYEDALAKFIVTGRGSVRQVVTGLEESLVKAGLKKGVSLGLQGVGKLGEKLSDAGHEKLGGLLSGIAGIGGKRGDSPSNPLYVQNVGGLGSGGGLLGGLPLPGLDRIGGSVYGGDKGIASITSAVTGAGGGKVGLGGIFGTLGSIFKSLFGSGKAGSAPTAGAVSGAKGSAFKANLGKLGKFDEGFQPQQKKSGGLFGMLGSLASIGAMFIPGGQALSIGMMALKAGLTAAPMLGGGLDALTGLAGGGDVTPGQAYVVGEKRPELFVPNAAGRIYPNVNTPRGGGSGETHLHFVHNVSTVDSTGFEELLNRHSRAVANHVTRVLRKENM